MRLAVSDQALDHDLLAEGELVALARAGEEGAVRAIIRRYNQQLFRAARGIVRDDAEAEDIVQETYVRGFTHLESFRGESSLSTWLTRIALNEALGRLRRRRPTVGLDQLDAGQGSGAQVIQFPTSVAPGNPETEAGRAEVRDVLERAVDELPDPFRIVFMLREIQGLTTEETAAQLSIRPETVKTRLHRARKLLRAAVEKMLSGRFSDLFPFDGQRCAHMADRVVSRLRG